MSDDGLPNSALDALARVDVGAAWRLVGTEDVID
jgi:hypothetical protein